MKTENQTTINRRTFLLTGLFSMLPLPTQGNFDANADVVVVGGGAAGIAATYTLLNKGISTALVEAAGHLGGRCVTDISKFGVPYDLGAHWLHNGQQNPYNSIAKQLGFELYLSPNRFHIFKDGNRATRMETENLWNTYDEVENAINRAGRLGIDVAALEVVDHVQNEWTQTVYFIIAPWSMAKDIDQFSTLDFWNNDGQYLDYFCTEGFGAVVAKYAERLQPSLNTTVQRIDWSGQSVKIDTNRGSLHPRAVLITASTGVLANDVIQFHPPLPLEKQESFASISMGLYNHIALLFSQDVLASGSDTYVIYQIGNDGKGFGTLCNAAGTNLSYCDVGGSWAKELEQESVDFQVDYALSQLKHLYGNDISKYFVKGDATFWGENPYTLGSYASAKPGAYKMRQVLREPVADRIFFAGEACSQPLWASVGGAHMSGVEVAEQLAKTLR